MPAQKSQKVRNSTNPIVKPARAKAAVNAANAGVMQAKKASQKTANVSQGSTSTIDPKEDELRRLRAEIAQLRQASVATPNNEAKIPRPRQAGNKLFRLRDVMGLEDDGDKYNAIRRSVKRHVDRAGLDPNISWHDQPKEEIVAICQLAKSEHPYLKRFPHNWATEEFIKRLMKNRREYGHRLNQKSLDNKGEEGEDNRDGGEDNMDGGEENGGNGADD